MLARVSIATLILFSWAAFAPAQVIRFETTVGDFDMVLNPTNDPRLQGNVNNLLNYVRDNRYRGTWINRAPEGFVLQMGGFYSHTKRVPINIDSTRPLDTFAPVAGAPATELGLSNTTGTVAFALPSDASGPLQDAGTSSFFINISNNDFLDPDFTVFAAIPDMTVVNQIMALEQIDLRNVPNFGAGSNNAGFQDVPLTEDNKQVFIKNAFVVTDTLSVARAMSGVQSVMAASAAAAESAANEALAASSSSAAVPEPATILSALAAMMAIGAFTRRRRL
jgi:cyclophilin family peptidyl-prolyl cis-trans isomerase